MTKSSLDQHMTANRASEDLATRLDSATTELTTLRASNSSLQRSSVEQSERVRQLEEMNAQLSSGQGQSYRAQLERALAMLAEAEQGQRDRAAELAALHQQVQEGKKLLTEQTAELRAVVEARAALAKENEESQKREKALHGQVLQLVERENQLVAQKDGLEVRLAKERINSEFALEEAECLVAEIRKTHDLEKQVMEEQASRLAEEEQRSAAMLRKMQKDIDELRQERLLLSTERDQLIGHQNIQQKIQVCIPRPHIHQYATCMNSLVTCTS